MKQLTLFKFTACAAFFFATGCNPSNGDTTAGTNSDSTSMTTKADPVKLKEEIQVLETAWANADNARDVNTLTAFYSDDAVSMANNQPMFVGSAAIKKDIETSMAKRPKGSTVSYDILDVFGSGDYVTEIGKTTRKDSTGKTTSTGKYMAIWEKRNGKWLCIRDISNDDAKEK